MGEFDVEVSHLHAITNNFEEERITGAQQAHANGREEQRRQIREADSSNEGEILELPLTVRCS